MKCTRTTTRRQLLTTTGLAFSATAAGSLIPRRSALADTGATPPGYPWPYATLDPEHTALSAYQLYDEGHCMFALFKSIVSQCEPSSSGPFPYQLFAYGMGGVMGWGGLCGAMNGAAAVVSLLIDDGREQGKLVHELFRWYEQAALPTWTPPGSAGKLVTSVAGSVTCHVSASRWCSAAGKKFFDPSRLERCKRLTAQATSVTVALLNDHFSGQLPVLRQPGEQTQKCQSCHTPVVEKSPAFGQHECATCHSMGKNHPPSE